MTGIFFIVLVAFGAALVGLFRRMRSLEGLVADLRDQLAGIDPDRMAPRTAPRRAPVVLREADLAAAPEPSAAVREQARAADPPRAIFEPAPNDVPDIVPAAVPGDEPAAEAPAGEPMRIGFEAIVGGKLPIWIGGAALVLAAFFLVRYSIENGLLGPAARTILGGLFGLALIAAGEGARRLPATRDDPRIGQALAGAGIAILYGTLYVGAALYHLIGAGPAFATMVAVTIGALALALRHGPPTAVMALVGGFAAPLIAGFDAAGIGPLLVYLALLVAALFGLAIRRGWIWLAIAACGGGFAWVNILVAALGGHDLAGIGGFVLLLAIGATLALPRTGAAKPWLRLLPLLTGLVQLLVLAPALDFGPLAWGLYLVLSAAALWLAWRDAALAPGAAAALVLVLLLLGVALGEGERANAPLAACAVTILFAVPGHLFARRGAIWAGIALGGTAGPVILAVALQHDLLMPVGWAGLLAVAALACVWLSWRGRDEASDAIRFSGALTGGAAAGALLFGIAVAEVIPDPWRWPAWLALGIGLAAWSRRSRDTALGHLALAPILVTAVAVAIGYDRLAPYVASIFTSAPRPAVADLVAIGVLPAALIAATAWLLPPGRARAALAWTALALLLMFIPAALPAPWHAVGLGLATAALILLRLPLRGAAVAAGLVTLGFTAPILVQLLILVGGSLLGNRLPWRDLPPILAILRELGLPAALIGAALMRRLETLGPWRSRAIIMLAAIGAMTTYALLKTPLAIATLPRFEAYGFLERMVITHLAFAASWAIERRPENWAAVFGKNDATTTIDKRQPVIARALLILALGRLLWFDLLILNPVLVPQSVGPLPVLNLATADVALAAAWLWPRRADRRWHAAMLALVLVAVAVTVRQAMHGAILTGSIGRTENWLYSAAFLGLALAWLARGIATGRGDLRIAGLALLTGVTLKVFLIDAAALEGILRILSFLGLGLALIGIGWAYGKVFVRPVAREPTGA